MKVLSGLACSIFMVTAYGQKNVEITDTRNQKESFAKVVQKDVRADVATFAMGGVDESVGKEPLQKIAFTALSQDSITFSGDDVEATIYIGAFDPTKHKLDYDEKTLTKIDRKTYYGSYGNIPESIVSKLTVIIGGDTVAIPPATYADIYNPKLSYVDKSGVERSRNAVYKSKDGHKIYLYLFTKDATGSYEVTWVIQDKKYLRRILNYGFM
ncbi:MAG: hypothetical protein ABIR81_07965 [Ginsengibacter sp.]